MLHMLMASALGALAKVKELGSIDNTMMPLIHDLLLHFPSSNLGKATRT